YFWRVKATQIVGGAVFALDSAWSVGSFTVVGLGPAPGTPSFTSPASPAQFHVREFFLINWTAVPGAHHYLLEADDEPTFSYPLTLTLDALQFETSFRAGWGNALNAFYRIVAVSAGGVRSLPSPTLSVQITNAAPVPPPPTLLSPIGGATVTLPFTLDWTDTANPQVAGYDVDIDNEPNFLGTVGVLFVGGVTRSDYMVVPDPLVEGFNHFPPGTYFWRVRDDPGARRDGRQRPLRLRPRLAGQLTGFVADPLGRRARPRERGRGGLRPGDGDAAQSGATWRRRGDAGEQRQRSDHAASERLHSGGRDRCDLQRSHVTGLGSHTRDHGFVH